MKKYEKSHALLETLHQTNLTTMVDLMAHNFHNY